MMDRLEGWIAIFCFTGVWSVVYIALDFVLTLGVEAYSRDGVSKSDYRAHLLSFIHAVGIVGLAGSTLLHPDSAPLYEDKIFGTAPMLNWCFHLSLSYFLWDLWHSIAYVKQQGMSFVIHAVSCSAVYGACYQTGLLGYFAPFFLLWELSTPFKDVLYFLTVHNMLESTLYFVNGILFALSFFISRNVLGLIGSYDFWVIWIGVYQAEKISSPLFYSIGAFNIALNSLNLFWMWKIIRKLQRALNRKAKKSKSS